MKKGVSILLGVSIAAVVIVGTGAFIMVSMNNQNADFNSQYASIQSEIAEAEKKNSEAKSNADSKLNDLKEIETDYKSLVFFLDDNNKILPNYELAVQDLIKEINEAYGTNLYIQNGYLMNYERLS